MNPKFKFAVIFFSIMALTAAPLFAQNNADAEDAEELTSAIKKISVSFHGGYYSGASYFELPELDDRAQLEELSNTLRLFDNNDLDLGSEIPITGIGAPISKELDPGSFYYARVGFYLSDAIHIDLFGSYTKSTASIHVSEFRFGERIGSVTFPEDSRYLDNDFKVYMGGMSLQYDAFELQKLGFVPFFGFGFGGIINRFTALEDKTALYFQMSGGLAYPITDHFRLETRASVTTYSFSTEEVDYANQVVSTNFSFGGTFTFDVKPIYNR
jgi:hypothetical protein